jgi:hypothetical protein
MPFDPFSLFRPVEPRLLPFESAPLMEFSASREMAGRPTFQAARWSDTIDETGPWALQLLALLFRHPSSQ